MTTRSQSWENRTFRQEAFASSTELERGILGNLVAARCSKLTDREEIAVLWWLQQVSWREGGLAALAEEFLKMNEAEIGTSTMHKFGRQRGQFYTEEQVREIEGDFCPMGNPPYRTYLLGSFPELRSIAGYPNPKGPARFPVVPLVSGCRLSVDDLVQLLQRALVDPSSSLKKERWNFRRFWDALVAFRSREVAATRSRFVETDIAAAIFEELDFSLETKSFVLIEGHAGIGKTEAAKNWCARHPGRAVYVRLESGSDETSLFRCIARAVGTACSCSRKTSEVRARLEDALQPGHLMLCLDESHFLWPQSDRAKRSAPKRVDWLRSALIDFSVPVALISTPQYFANACEKFRSGGWNATQIERRLAPAVVLPETPSMESVTAVTRHYFPNATTKETKLIAGAALTSIGFLTTIVHLRKRVDFLKSRHPEVLESAHLKTALAAYIAIPEAAKGQPAECAREGQNARQKARCSAPATSLHSRFSQPEITTKRQFSEPSLTVT